MYALVVAVGAIDSVYVDGIYQKGRGTVQLRGLVNSECWLCMRIRHLLRDVVASSALALAETGFARREVDSFA